MIKKKFLTWVLLTIFTVVLFREITPHQHYSKELSYRALDKKEHSEKSEHDSHHHGLEALSNFFGRLKELKFPYINNSENVYFQKNVSLSLTDIVFNDNDKEIVKYSPDWKFTIIKNEVISKTDLLITSVSFRGPPSNFI